MDNFKSMNNRRVIRDETWLVYEWELSNTNFYYFIVHKEDDFLPRTRLFHSIEELLFHTWFNFCRDWGNFFLSTYWNWTVVLTATDHESFGVYGTVWLVANCIEKQPSCRRQTRKLNDWHWASAIRIATVISRVLRKRQQVSFVKSGKEWLGGEYSWTHSQVSHAYLLCAQRKTASCQICQTAVFNQALFSCCYLSYISINLRVQRRITTKECPTIYMHVCITTFCGSVLRYDIIFLS